MHFRQCNRSVIPFISIVIKGGQRAGEAEGKEGEAMNQKVYGRGGVKPEGPPMGRCWCPLQRPETKNKRIADEK